MSGGGPASPRAGEYSSDPSTYTVAKQLAGAHCEVAGPEHDLRDEATYAAPDGPADSTAPDNRLERIMLSGPDPKRRIALSEMNAPVLPAGLVRRDSKPLRFTDA